MAVSYKLGHGRLDAVKAMKQRAEIFLVAHIIRCALKLTGWPGTAPDDGPMNSLCMGSHALQASGGAHPVLLSNTACWIYLLDLPAGMFLNFVPQEHVCNPWPAA